MRGKLFFLAIYISLSTYGQDGDSLNLIPYNYALVITAGGGGSYYISEPGVPKHLSTTTSRISPSASIRLMWFPDHRLRFGLETGYTNFYQYKVHDNGTNATLELSAIPLLIEWSMQLGDRINVFAGTGTYVIRSRLNYRDIVSSTSLSLGWMLAVSYNIPISEDLFFTPEIKWFDAEESHDQSLNIQTLLVWKFFKR